MKDKVKRYKSSPIKIILIVVWISFSSVMVFSQKSNVWLTYGQSAFLYSPGVEANIFIHRSLGIQIGLNTYFQSYNTKQIVNISDDYSFNFYNLNLGIISEMYQWESHQIGGTLGFKMYYGPQFEILHFYPQGGYNIYYDASELRPAYGLDMGISYSYKKITALIKWDTARQKWRFGLGYSFGN